MVRQKTRPTRINLITMSNLQNDRLLELYYESVSEPEYLCPECEKNFTKTIICKKCEKRKQRELLKEEREQVKRDKEFKKICKNLINLQKDYNFTLHILDQFN